ncbi:MAG: hypothetical protein AAFS10_20445, partial [Myxococcota bacterium]
VLFRARDLRVGGNLVLIKAIKYDMGMFGYNRQKALYHVYSMRQRFKREKNILIEMARRGLNNVPTLNDFFYDNNPDLGRTFPFGEFDAQELLSVNRTELAVTIDDEPYIVMERIFGRSLQEILTQLSEARLLEIARAVCRVLERIHAPRGRTDGLGLSFIFMDLKPDNLIVDRQGGVILVDFGAAIPVIEGRRKGKGAFTPGFAPPEVRRIAHPSAIVDHRVDLYSLGAILYQALSVGHINPMDVASTLEDDFPVLDLAQLRANLHPKTRHVIARALARTPEERFTDATEMRQAIELALREV